MRKISKCAVNITVALSVFLFCVFGGTGLNITKAVMSQEPIEQPDGTDVFALQTEALEAWTELSAVFGANGDGSTRYPDDYAGAWIEGGKLYVAFTSDGAYYRELLNVHSCVEFVSAEFSLNELDRVRYTVAEELDESYGLSAHFVMVEDNKICFEFREMNGKTENLIMTDIKSIIADNVDLAGVFGKTDRAVETYFVLGEALYSVTTEPFYDSNPNTADINGIVYVCFAVSLVITAYLVGSSWMRRKPK